MSEERTVTGSCRYCGQIKMITLPEDEWLERIQKTNKDGRAIADELATEQCDCREGSDWRADHYVMDQCRQNIEDMFREDQPDIAEILLEAVPMVYYQQIKKDQRDHARAWSGDNEPQRGEHEDQILTKTRNGVNSELLMIGYPKQKSKKPRRTHPQSILHRKDGTCYLCCRLDHDYRRHKYLEEHHVFPGNPGRQISETFGFKVYLCQEHHRIGPAAVHNDPEMLRLIQRDIQEEYEQTHTREEWMAIMGKNYL